MALVVRALREDAIKHINALARNPLAHQSVEYVEDRKGHLKAVPVANSLDPQFCDALRQLVTVSVLMARLNERSVLLQLRTH